MKVDDFMFIKLNLKLYKIILQLTYPIVCYILFFLFVMIVYLHVIDDVTSDKTPQ